jgi:surface protein
MFDKASSFNKNISEWDVSNVTDMYYTFRDAKSFNQDISKWNISKVTNELEFFINNNNNNFRSSILFLNY